MQKKLYLTIISIFITISNANADQNIEIVGGSGAGLPKIAIVKFDNDTTGDDNLTDVIANDLSIMGEFNVKEYDSSDPIDATTQYVVTGSITTAADNSKVLSYKLQNHLTESAPALINQNVAINPSNIRRAGHQGSNAVYQQITNVPGAFTAKIAYILQNDSKYQIIVADYDGFNQKTLLTAHAPIISLAWDSTGNQLSYTSFESNKPVVYVQNLYKVNRYVVSNFSGSNSSPAFLPNGSNQLAVTLTKDYGSHIYLINNAPYSKRSGVSSLINFGTIDTEASIGKNGTILFTSNHDGGPQIFMTDLKGSTPVRQTINLGNYNTTPRLSHDLSKMTFINRNSGVLKTFVMDLATKASYPVSQNTSLDMSPSFAPNDKLILFSSNGFMYLVNTTGTAQTRLKKISGNIIDQRFANNPD